MRKIFFLLLVTICLLMPGCSTKQVSTYSSTNFKLIDNKILVNVTGKYMDPEIIDTLSHKIKKLLIDIGFDPNLATNAKSNLSLNVDVTKFSPGNAFVRSFIGFGAGRGSLLYTAEYINKEGDILAKIDGQERFTGGEASFNIDYGGFTSFGCKHTVIYVLINEAAMHIVDIADKSLLIPPQTGKIDNEEKGKIREKIGD